MISSHGIDFALCQFRSQLRQFFDGEESQLIRVDAFPLWPVLSTKQASDLLILTLELLQLLLDRVMLRGNDFFVLSNHSDMLRDDGRMLRDDGRMLRD